MGFAGQFLYCSRALEVPQLPWVLPTPVLPVCHHQQSTSAITRLKDLLRFS
jgi:hypothetical protein